VNDRSLWEEQAGWWQQGFTDGADPEYEEQILPLIDRHLTGSRRILDIGCGEGQAARRLTALGAEVIGLDPTRAQLRTARERAGGTAVLVAQVAVREPGAASEARQDAGSATTAAACPV